MQTSRNLFIGMSLLASGVIHANESNLALNTDAITVSGLSSGGYMATQFHLANSDKVVGAAMIASGPYYCAQGNIGIALGQCVDKVSSPLDVKTLSNQALAWANDKKIPSLDNLKNSTVWLLHGTADTRVNHAVSDALYQQYQQWVPDSQITYINDRAFSHLFPTVAAGVDCLHTESPYIGKCDYDAAGALLNALLGDLTPPDGNLTGEIIQYNQHDIGGDNAETMGETGYAYVPESCGAGAQCKVHISFHGCNQYADAVDLAYVEQTGLNQWADDNNLVVVYPQTKKSLMMPMNPQGCWDWWGYTSADYATSQGHQIKAVNAIIDYLAIN